MKLNYTDITIILDRSGSMNSIADATIAGFNEFVDEQALLPGEVKLSLIQFNTGREVTFTAAPVREVPHLHAGNYRPSGGTALLDAVALTIDATGQRLASLVEDDRPSKVIVAILTDGLENQSWQFNYSQVRERIGRQKEVYQWDFVFLGAKQDAIAEAAKLSIGADNALTFGASAKGAKAAFKALSKSAGDAHTGKKGKAEFDLLDRLEQDGEIKWGSK